MLTEAAALVRCTGFRFRGLRLGNVDKRMPWVITFHKLPAVTASR
jgi:hypothetical protein